jgi:CBS domain-containing membrane protein
MKKKIKRAARMTRYVIYRETLFDFKDQGITFLGSFVGVGLIGILTTLHLGAHDNLFLIGSFGASSVLIYGIVNSPLAQPRNLIGGHVICALVGVTVQLLIPEETWLAASLAVSISIVMMQITKTLHPPGGATALIATIGSEKIKALGYWYVLSPIFTGVMILFLVALIFNNLTPYRKYPSNKFWYKKHRKRKAEKLHLDHRSEMASITEKSSYPK